MADDGGFYKEHDPEWAISQLAAQVAAAATPAERRASWRVISGVLFTTALVAGAFITGLTHDAAPPDPGTPTAAEPRATLEPLVLPEVAPRATIAPAPEPAPKPEPVAAPLPVVETAISVAPAVAKPDKPSRPDNQVGPNKPIKTPIDPDDR